MTSISRGDLKPDLEIIIADNGLAADFTPLTAANVRFVLERDGAVVVNDLATSILAAPGGKSATVKRVWGLGETAISGRHWVSVVVDWPGSKPQTFPAEGPLLLDIVRAAGDL